MRLRLGRPDLTRYDDRFDVPAARGAFGATFLGVSSVLLDDGETAVLTDGFFSRPPMAKVLLGRLSPDEARIDAVLRRAGIDRLAVVAPVHTHYDHAMDSPAVVRRTGGVLAGGTSSANLGRGAGLAEDRILTVTPGRPETFGGFTLTWIESEHCPPDRFPGTIDEPVTPPVSTKAYRCGEAWSILVEHTSGRTALVQGSAGFRPGALAGRTADVAYLGVGQLGLQDQAYLRTYWAETVEATGAREVVLLHWDDFFRPLDEPLRALPYAGDDLDVTMRAFVALAEQQGVGLHFPTVWQREDPWSISPR